ncbi:MAG: hypothetical protein DMG24_01825 [Acidobacteria bacterium]|nr:MAG: hypothetical protein DMG24_01825 [Acidobacteriota bacterium]
MRDTRFRNGEKTSSRAIALVFIVLACAFNERLAGDSVKRPAEDGTRTPAKPEAVGPFAELPNPALLPDGTLAAFSISMHDGLQEVAARFSRDNGHSWGESQTLFRLPREAGGFGYFDVLVDRKGEVHLFFLCDANTGGALPIAAKQHSPVKETLDVWQARSRDKRKTWDPPKRIWEGRAGDLLSVVQLRSGRILLPISYLTSRTWAHRGTGFDAFTYMGTYDSGVLYSDDDGETWRQSSAALKVPTPDLGTIGGVEPVVIQLKNGRVWMLIRTQMGRFYESFSSDDGTTWSRPEPSPIVSSEAPAGLIRLKDGRIVLFLNNCRRFPYAYGGRHVLHAAISEDEGKTWRGYREAIRDLLRNQPPPADGDFGAAYPFPALTADGKVIFSTGVSTGTRSQHPAEDSGPMARHEERFLYILDPAWLCETHQKDDFSHGLDDWSVFGTQGVGLVRHPGKAGAQVLSVSKTHAEWPAGAVWNFPAGAKGHLHVRLLLNAGFKGALLGLTDHFSVPFDEEDRFYNLFNVLLDPGSAPVSKLDFGRWHDLDLEWDCRKRECRVAVDRGQVAVLSQLREAQIQGVSYLRLRLPPAATDSAGMLLESVEADVSPK